MKNIFSRGVLLLLLGSFSMAISCKKKVVEPEIDDREKITTVNILFEPTDKSSSVTVRYRDLDGDGGQAPTIENLVLKANTTYNATVTILDETKAAGQQDITEEIRTAGNDHQIFYVVTGANITVTPTDTDSNNRPIGLEATAVTTGASTGTLRLVLKHQPGLKNASSTINTGTTDVDVTFNTVVQ